MLAYGAPGVPGRAPLRARSAVAVQNIPPRTTRVTTPRPSNAYSSGCTPRFQGFIATLLFALLALATCRTACVRESIGRMGPVEPIGHERDVRYTETACFEHSSIAANAGLWDERVDRYLCIQSGED